MALQYLNWLLMCFGMTHLKTFGSIALTLVWWNDQNTCDDTYITYFFILVKVTLVWTNPKKHCVTEAKIGCAQPGQRTNNNKQNNNCFADISWPGANRADPIVPHRSSSLWRKSVTVHCMWLLNNNRSLLHSRGRWIRKVTMAIYYQKWKGSKWILQP